MLARVAGCAYIHTGQQKYLGFTLCKVAWEVVEGSRCGSPQWCLGFVPEKSRLINEHSWVVTEVAESEQLKAKACDTFNSTHHQHPQHLPSTLAEGQYYQLRSIRSRPEGIVSG
jgi:hypothetical protein